MQATELSYAEREQILNDKIHALVKDGWQLQHSTATAASLMFPKTHRPLFANLVLTVVTFGLWIFIWVLAFLLDPVPHDRHRHIEVLADGTVEQSQGGLIGWLKGTTYDESRVPPHILEARAPDPPEPQPEVRQSITPVKTKSELPTQPEKEPMPDNTPVKPDPITRVSSKEELDKTVSDYAAIGYRLKESGEESATLQRKYYGSPLGHVVVLLATVWFTFGLGNIAYVLFSYFVNGEKVVVRLN